MATTSAAAATTRKQCDRILSAISSQYWAITPAGLELVIGVAQRAISDKEAAADRQAEFALSEGIPVEECISVINVFGTIIPRATYFSDWSGGQSVESLSQKFNDALNHPMVKAIVLNIDSPGGNITGINEFAQQIYNARGGTKPVVAYVSGIGASAAYWIASAADKIIADETAVVGSIGVLAAWTDDKAARKSQGLKDYTIVSSQSPNKRLDPTTDEGRSAIQKELDALADIFIGAVARNRDTSAEDVAENFGQGGTMLAGEAIAVGMADSFGSLQSVIADLSGYNSTKQEQSRNGGNIMGKAAKDEELKVVAAAAAGEPGQDEDASKKDDEEKCEDVGSDTTEEEDGEGDGEDKEDMSASATSAALIQKGVLQERARIQAIEDMGIVGHDALVAKAKSYGTSPEALAMSVLNAEKKSRSSLAKQYETDASEVAGVPAGGQIAEADEQAVIKAMASGMVAGGHKLKLVTTNSNGKGAA
jgi:signal peptide peptidase SppA